MNNIGFGIFCFGDEFYYRGSVEKINQILEAGAHCYVLTENPDFFKSKYSDMFLHVTLHQREVKSYYDKLILLKTILKKHDIAILLDADTNVKDYNVFKDLMKYNFKYGVSYIETLLAHSAKREFVKNLINIQHEEWNAYDLYAKKLYPTYEELQTIWEYFLAVNKIGFNEKRFFAYYERLQIAKEFSDIRMAKKIIGAGEGISTAIACKLSHSDLNYDLDLKELLKDKLTPITKHTPHNELPDWMK